jgi:Lar family restriction alleviation protein
MIIFPMMIRTKNIIIVMAVKIRAEEIKMGNRVEVKILPCPFCGGEGRRVTTVCGGFDELEHGVIRCGTCGASGPECTTDWGDITDKWNRRVSRP